MALPADACIVARAKMQLPSNVARRGDTRRADSPPGAVVTAGAGTHDLPDTVSVRTAARCDHFKCLYLHRRIEPAATRPADAGTPTLHPSLEYARGIYLPLHVTAGMCTSCHTYF